MILQLDPPIPMITPKGKGYANFLVDRGMEFDNEWIVFLESGEVWSFLNSKVRIQDNYTHNRVSDGKHNTRRQCSDEYAKETAGAIQQLQPEVSPVTRPMGTGPTQYREESTYAEFQPRIERNLWLSERNPKGACC